MSAVPFSTRRGDGIPCTISSLMLAQMLAGKPYSPLKLGVAPSWERMNASAMRSSSAVEMPGRMALRIA